MLNATKAEFMISKKMPGLIWYLLVIPIVVMDQLSKLWALKALPDNVLQVFPGLQFSLAHNYGVAFGVFNDKFSSMRSVVLIVAILISLLIAGWLLKTPRRDKLMGFSLVFILSGAIGNIIDRVMYGYVVDFIDFYFYNWHWPAFNIADSFITVGAIMLLATIIFPKEVK